jgi:hypothetical protein
VVVESNKPGMVPTSDRIHSKLGVYCTKNHFRETCFSGLNRDFPCNTQILSFDQVFDDPLGRIDDLITWFRQKPTKYTQSIVDVESHCGQGVSNTPN